MSDFFEPVDPDDDDNQNSSYLHKEVDSVFDNIIDEMDDAPVTEESDTDNTPSTSEQTPTDTTEVVEEPSNNQEPSTLNTEEAPINYEEFYKEMMSPIKANGKTFSLQSAQEARQLIQMGANYTKKMQEIAPQRKILEYLKQNNLDSEQDILYLVDLAKGNESALQKLIQDKQIDINNISNTEYDDNGNPKPVTYIPSSSMPDDKYMAVDNVMKEIQETPEGYNFIQEVCSWDSASRAYLYNNPTVLYELQNQKYNGIFNKIAEEVERRKAVGSIPITSSFIEAYAKVGSELYEKGLLQSSTPNQSNQNNSNNTTNNVVTKPYIQHGNTTMQNSNVNNNNNAAQVRSAGLTRMNNSSVRPSGSKTAKIKNLYTANISGNLTGDDFIKEFNKIFNISE